MPIAVAASEAGPVLRAIGDLQADLQQVLGSAPERQAELGTGEPVIVIGQVGTGGLIDQLIAAKVFNPGTLEGAWESFVIEAVDEGRLLVVAGSDPRGTIYGIYELSRLAGVSPWAWWADVPLLANPEAAISVERRREGPPAVKYRGIFLNDEDWAMHPWAAQTFDPELGDIGPKTYAKVFELLLRLRGNCLWPAMHKISRPFNADRQNAELADAYGIVMGASHAEPLLRNNVREWTAPHADYNFLTNREGVLAYWEERLETNGGFENLYTIGMRGIHDSGMQGASSLEERIETLETIFAAQRDLLAKHVEADIEQVPQIFVAYKEVLELYRAGLEVPDDVTVVWPDDNFGYLRNFASESAQAERSGGFGVYHHLSYLGRPMAYLWLNTASPAFLWEELAKAYAHGADRFWMLNVGDLKPAEIGIDFFFDLAWDTPSWGVERVDGFLREWAAAQFGETHASAIADILDGYYLLNFRRRPEHLQYYKPLTEMEWSGMSERGIDRRLQRFAALESAVDRLEGRLDPAFQDAFFELVAYPVRGSAAANRRYFWTERYARAPSLEAAEKAHAAEAELQSLTTHYNEGIANGKWRHYMALEPADRDWRSMRIAPLELPPEPASLTGLPAKYPRSPEVLEVKQKIPARRFAENRSAESGAWTVIPGLGRSGAAITVLPFSGEAWSDRARPTVTYLVDAETAGRYTVTIELLPTFPLEDGGDLRLGVGVNEGDTQTVLAPRREAGDPLWSDSVLRNYLPVTLEVELRAGANKFRLEALERGVVVDRLVVERKSAQ